MTFRHDINGLRAIAVISVVLFHFQVPGFSAGFLGVDVFFVISGFLMAGILLKRLDNNPSGGGVIQLLWDFYLARARRILPALLVLVLVLLAVGWWTLGPEDYERLAKHARYAVVFASNHQFYGEAGYFDVQSHEKWLLHTWSLSVEWQFYLLLPLLLLALWKIKLDRVLMLWVVGGAAVISFLYGAMQTSANAEAAFYLLPSRAWELLVGVFVYLISARIAPAARWSAGLELVGLGLIILALFLYNQNTPWPGVAALLPVTGTALVLLAGKQTPAWATPASVQWMGKSSYSLYLWHWPVFVALVFLDLQSSTFAIIAGIAIALLLSAISYAYVEQPSRKGLMRLGMKWAAVPLVIAASGIASAALVIGKMDGLPERMPEEFNRIMAEINNVNPHRQNCHGHPRMEAFPWCILGGGDIQAVVVGDSHASNIVTAVTDALRLEAHEGVVMATYTSCQTILGIRKPNPRLRCNEFNEFVVEQLQTLPDDVPLIIAARLSAAFFGSHLRHEKSYGIPSLYFGDEPYTTVTDDYLEEVRSNMIASACFLSRNRPVYWLTPFPELPRDAPRWLARKALLTGGAELSISRTEYEERNGFVKTLLAEAEAQCPNFRVIDVAPVFCDDARCYGSKDGMPLFYDEHHVSERGNRLLVGLFKQHLDSTNSEGGNQVLINDGNFLFYNQPVAQKSESGGIYLSYVTRYGRVEVAKIVEGKDRFVIENISTVHNYSETINYERGRASDDHAAPAIILNKPSNKLYLATAYHGTDLHIYEKDLRSDLGDFHLVKTVSGRYTYPSFFHVGEHVFLLARKQNAGVRDGDLVMLSSQDNFTSERVLISSGEGKVIYASFPVVAHEQLWLQYSTLSYASRSLEGWNLFQFNFEDNQSSDIDLSQYIPGDCVTNRPTGIGINANNLFLATACFEDGFRAQTLRERFFSRVNKVRILALDLDQALSPLNFTIVHDGEAQAPYYHTSVSFNADGNWVYFDDAKIISDLNWSDCDVSDGNAMYPNLFGNHLFYARPNAGFYEIRDFDSSIRYCVANEFIPHH